MKKLLLLLLFVPAFSYGYKNPCRNIKKFVDRKKGTILYKSPDFVNTSVIKQVRTNPYFGLMFHFNDRAAHYDATGASIEFEDGSVITDRDTKVICTQHGVLLDASSNAGATVNSGEYVLQGFFRITNDNIQKLMTLKIVSISLDNAFQRIREKEALQLINYVTCLKDRDDKK